MWILVITFQMNKQHNGVQRHNWRFDQHQIQQFPRPGATYTENVGALRSYNPGGQRDKMLDAQGLNWSW